MGDIPEIMKPYRSRIDAIDDRIVDLLVERAAVIREVADVKYHEGIPAVLQDRVDAVRERAAERAKAKGIDPETVRRIYKELIAYSCGLEQSIMDGLARRNRKGAAP